jgi:hypothetical protein
MINTTHLLLCGMQSVFGHIFLVFSCMFGEHVMCHVHVWATLLPLQVLLQLGECHLAGQSFDQAMECASKLQVREACCSPAVAGKCTLAVLFSNIATTSHG